jgi:glutamate racemase
MKSLLGLLGEKQEWRIVLTDSGLGGLSICAGLEKRLHDRWVRGRIDLVYVNAWPETGRGYNDLPDVAARAAVFDRALTAMGRFRPDLIVIACNTLSVLYGLTEFAKTSAVPVAGIIDEGIDLFAGALKENDAATLVLFGTRTTIESGEHVRRLVLEGIDPRRVRAAACHGLAGAIDKDPGSASLPELVNECVSRALADGEVEGTLYAALACTHYSFIAGIFRNSLARHARGGVAILDPGEGLVKSLTAGTEQVEAAAAGQEIAVDVVSKVELPRSQREAFARRLGPVSSRTARALLGYTHIPDLF